MAMVKRAAKKDSKPGKGNLPPWLQKNAAPPFTKGGKKGGKAPKRGKKSKVINKD